MTEITTRVESPRQPDVVRLIEALEEPPPHLTMSASKDSSQTLTDL